MLMGELILVRGVVHFYLEAEESDSVIDQQKPGQCHIIRE